MTRYCLDTQEDSAAVIHRLDCSAYDLGTLLGLGCVVDLGDFATLAEALRTIEARYPEAVRCPVCCQAQVMQLPLRQKLAPGAITTLSG